MTDPVGLDTGDQSFFLLSAALVQLMTPGLAFFYGLYWYIAHRFGYIGIIMMLVAGGLVSEKSVVNTLMLSFGTMGVVTVLWALVGYSLAFGPSISTGVIGDLSLSVVQFNDQIRVGTTVTEHAFFCFQLMFAIITPALISGAVVRRIRFWWFMLFVAFWHIFVYCPLAHYIFYNGWLMQMGVLDFAGGMVIHTSSGVSGLVLAYWMGKPTRDVLPEQPHNVPFVLLGAGLLWFGWFGFNAGSAVHAGAVAGRAFTNTQLATCTAMMMWNILEVIAGGKEGWFTGRPTSVGAAVGAVTGLVAITPACGFVTAMWALFIGAFTTLVVFWFPKIIRKTGIVDVMDTFAIHGIGGMCGSLLTGLFATTDANGAGLNGGFYGSGHVFAVQIAAVLVTLAFSVIGTSLIVGVLALLSRAARIPLSMPDEMLDDHDTFEHAELAYHTPRLTGSASNIAALTAANKLSAANLSKLSAVPDSNPATAASPRSEEAGAVGMPLDAVVPGVTVVQVEMPKLKL